MSEWQPTSNPPPESVPVWLFEPGRGAWIGCYEYEDGWCYTNAYNSWYLDGEVWKAGDSEFDDDYKPTHWMPLPPPPKEPTRSESLIHSVNHVVEPREGE